MFKVNPAIGTLNILDNNQNHKLVKCNKENDLSFYLIFSKLCSLYSILYFLVSPLLKVSARVFD